MYVHAYVCLHDANIYTVSVYIHIRNSSSYSPPLEHFEQCNKLSGRPFKFEVL